VLPSVELAVEEGTAVPVIRQSRQVGVDARDEAACTIGGAAASGVRVWSWCFAAILFSDSPSSGCGEDGYIV